MACGACFVDDMIVLFDGFQLLGCEILDLLRKEARLGNATELCGSWKCGILDVVYYMWL